MLHKLGQYLLQKGYDYPKVKKAFDECDTYFMLLHLVDDTLFKHIADFTEQNNIEFTEFLGTFSAEELYDLK